VRYKLY